VREMTSPQSRGRAGTSQLTQKSKTTSGKASRPAVQATPEENVQYVIGNRQLRDLIGGVTDALRSIPPFYISSILGPPWTWLPILRRYSEFGILDVWQPGRTLGFLLDIGVPSVPKMAPPFIPPLAKRLFWHPSQISQIGDQYGNQTSHPKEAWLFINGIATDCDLACINAAYLTFLFHRPITLIQNSTGGFLEDLLECALDKATFLTGEAATKGFPTLYDALKDENKQRVVLIAHSQGTIIASVMLRFIERITMRDHEPALYAAWERNRPKPVNPEDAPLDPRDFEPLKSEEINKLEVYCFANCATQFRYITKNHDNMPIPWIESYGNEYDLVARLGMLAPHSTLRDVHIDGPQYVRRGAWGHLLNDCYLRPIEHVQRKGRKRGPRLSSTAAPYELLNQKEFPGTVPRLYHYLNGGSPPEEAV
jgi:hypothetical protein